MSLLLPGPALGEPRLIHVEMSYPGTASSFILYADGVQVCTSATPESMDCTVEIGTAPMTFTLTAVAADGVEGPPSAPYILVPPTPDPNVAGNYIPKAQFTTSVTTGDAPLPVSFDASSSTDLGGMIVSYVWDFGDGSTGTGELIDYTFTGPGTYTATLTTSDDEGASAVKTATITVAAPPLVPPPAAPANLPPVAVITANPPAAGTTQVGLDGSASTDSDGTVVSYAWNFGDGETATGVSAQHDFSTAGDYTVVLTVTDDKGGTSLDQMVVTVVDAPKPPNLPPGPVISASSRQRLLHYAWEYTATDTTLAGFKLYQNDRVACEIADPTAREADCLAYVDNGVVKLWITAYDQSGVESAPSEVMTFDNTGLSSAAGGEAPLTVHFTTGASADPDGTITSYAWDFGDGSIAEGREIDHLFTSPGDYTVTLTVTDDHGDQGLATMVIPVNLAQPPVAVNASFSTAQDKSVTATLSANDPNGNPLTFRVTRAGSLGTATITNDTTGVFTYLPKAGASGLDSFAFKANDGSADSNEAVVSIAIQESNSAPIASNQAVTIQEDAVASATLTATDPETKPLTFTLVILPAHGVASLVNAGTGAFTYQPHANFNGTDSFTFKANDGSLDSAKATVTVTIVPVNDVPEAAGVKVTTNSGSVSGGEAVGASGVSPSARVATSTLAAGLAFTSPEDVMTLGQLVGIDPDGDRLTFSVVTNGSLGVVRITDRTTGAFTYTPNLNTNGQDTFVYRVSDGKSSAKATVTATITPVNDAPKANLDLARVKRGESLLIPVLANDTDLEGNPLALVSVKKRPAYGKAEVIKRRIQYTADPTFVGIVPFTYSIKDGAGGMATGRVKVTVSE